MNASDASHSDRFGSSVAISGNIAIVGAPEDDNAGNNTNNSGSAYLFDVNTGNQLFKLTATDAMSWDELGGSVAINGNYAIVGAAGSVAGNTGKAYLFDVSTGAQLAILAASDAGDHDSFGHSVAISGNFAIVGAPGGEGAGSTSGAAYLFDVTNGNEISKLTLADTQPFAGFGLSVSISGETAIVGAYQDFGNFSRTGAAYLFDVTTGSLLDTLNASDSANGDQFGRAVGISGDQVIIGASHDGLLDTGSIYLYGLGVPEPTTLSLAVLAGSSLLIRRTRRNYTDATCKSPANA